MRPIIFLIAIIYSSTTNAQVSDSIRLDLPSHEFRDLGVIFGVHQFSNTFVELGISATKSKGGCVWGSYFHGASLSAEYNPFQNKIGTTITAWTSLATFITVGTNINSYSDFKRSNFGIKPFIGIGPGNISFTYGYNIQIVDNGVTDLNTHCFSFRFHLPIWVF